jgi:hypothetical protein
MPRVPAANAGSRALARDARQQQCWMPRSLMTSEENSGEIPPTKRLLQKKTVIYELNS